MRIAIFGVGGVGGYFGGRLVQSGENVVFIARGKHLEALRGSGLRVDSLLGDFSITKPEATDNPSEAGTVDVVLVAVKAWQVPEAARAIPPLLGPETFVVPLENGVEAPSQLAEVLGENRVVGGLCRIISFIAEPGYIKHVGATPDVAFGELNLQKSERTERLLQAFVNANVRAKIPENIHTAIWEKFLFIASISGVGAVTRAPAGVVRKIPETRNMLQRAMQEIYELARARQIPMKENAVELNLTYVDSLPESATASMQRDILDGKPSELESQNGAVVRLARHAGVLTPVHEFIYASLLPSELRARGKSEVV